MFRVTPSTVHGHNMSLSNFFIAVGTQAASGVARNIVSIADATDIEMEPTTFNSLGLPTTRMATLSNGNQELVSILWDPGDYTGQVGIFDFVGTPIETATIKNPDGITST